MRSHDYNIADDLKIIVNLNPSRDAETRGF